MAVTLPRVPGQKHWEVSSSLFQQMEPTEFLTYWDVSYSKLAKICHCSTRTVERWLVGSRGVITPRPSHLNPDVQVSPHPASDNLVALFQPAPKGFLHH